jgi:putative phage-type endonuclease
MARLILPECAGHEAWLKARQGGIGGSEIGALIGVSEYETPFSVWNTKAHGGKDLSHLAPVEWGHRLEEVVAQKTAEMVGLVSRPGGGLWVSTALNEEFLRVTPDRFACHSRKWRAVGVFECKTAGEDEGWQSGSIAAGGQGDGAAPLSYQAQLQWQLGILGLNRGWLGCLVLGSARNFYVVECEFDAAWFAEMREEATRFWHVNVLGDEPPMHDLRHPKTEELMRYLHPAVVRPSVELPSDADEWLEGYQAAKADVDRAQARLDEIKNYFRMQVADAAAGYLGDRKVVSYPEVTTNRIDVEALKRDHPEIAAEVTVKSTHRRMTIRVPKK